MDNLGKMILLGLAVKYGVPALIVGGVLGYITLEAHNETVRNERISHVFTAAGIPAEKQEIVRDVLLNQGGNCGLLSTDLQNPCETAKKNLGIHYEMPRPVVTINPK